MNSCRTYPKLSWQFKQFAKNSFTKRRKGEPKQQNLKGDVRCQTIGILEGLREFVFIVVFFMQLHSTLSDQKWWTSTSTSRDHNAQHFNHGYCIENISDNRRTCLAQTPNTKLRKCSVWIGVNQAMTICTNQIWWLLTNNYIKMTRSTSGTHLFTLKLHESHQSSPHKVRWLHRFIHLQIHCLSGRVGIAVTSRSVIHIQYWNSKLEHRHCAVLFSLAYPANLYDYNNVPLPKHQLISNWNGDILLTKNACQPYE